MSNIKTGDHVGVIDASKYANLRGRRGIVGMIRTLYGQNEYEVLFRDENGRGRSMWIPESDLVSVENNPLRRYGARVRVIGNGHHITHHAPIGSVGKIVYHGPLDTLVVEFDKPIWTGFQMEYTQFISPGDLEFVKEEKIEGHP